MSLLSREILERFRITHGKDIDLGLRSPYANLLTRFGNPEKRIPAPILVAGTNGKGSTCAFLRAMVEATGRTAHVYTSPHLVSFHERIRIAGRLITEDELSAILSEAETLAEPGGISLFEAQTAAALVAFARTKADVTILEVGLGGRLDATNIVPAPIAALIARLSFDHREYLGDTMAAIAREKAGIMRPGTPCFTMQQPSQEALASLREEARKLDAPLSIGGDDWRIEETDGNHFRFISTARTIENLPRPALCGDHQLWNAGLAIASLTALPFEVSDDAVRKAMTSVAWPGRLQHLTQGRLLSYLPPSAELWLDGGHNDSAGEALARQMKKWQQEDSKPLNLVFGMLKTKVPEEFLAPMIPYVRSVRTLPIACEMPSFAPEELAERVRGLGVQNVTAALSFEEALRDIPATTQVPSRTLICGSLYLVGHALEENGSK